MSNLEDEIQLIYVVKIDGKATWAFKNKDDAIDLIEKKLHLKKDKIGDSWGCKGYQNKAAIMSLELE